MAELNAPPAAAALLRAARSYLIHRQALNRLRLVLRCATVAAVLVATVHLTLRALSPLVLAGLIVSCFAAGAILTLLRRPGLPAAAAFIDQDLQGEGAYGMLLELQQRALHDGEAVQAFGRWINAHATRRASASMPGVSWPTGSLISCLVAALLAAVLLQFPGMTAARYQSQVSSATTFEGRQTPSDLAAAPATTLSPSHDPDIPASDLATNDRAEGLVKAQVAAAGSVDPAALAQSADRTASAGRPEGAERQAARGGLAAGAAQDFVLARQLAGAVGLGTIERHTVSPAVSLSASRREGADFGPDADRNRVGLRSPLPAVPAAVAPPQYLTSVPPEPAARVLVTRYLTLREGSR